MIRICNDSAIQSVPGQGSLGVIKMLIARVLEQVFGRPFIVTCFMVWTSARQGTLNLFYVQFFCEILILFPGH